MIIELHPTYTIRVTVVDRPQQPSGVGLTVDINGVPRAWQGSERRFCVGDTYGCDQVVQAVREALKNIPGVRIELVKFEMTANG